MLSVPTRAQCLLLMDAVQLPENIREHSMIVAEIASFLALHLNRNGNRLDMALVEAGALLHDIAKGICLKSNCNHAEMGAAMVNVWGYKDVAVIVKEHVRIEESMIKGSLTESLIVNYADKRVKHTELVDLETRFHDLVRRYGVTEGKRKRILAMLPLYLELERRIFQGLPFCPGDLKKIFQDSLPENLRTFWQAS